MTRFTTAISILVTCLILAAVGFSMRSHWQSQTPNPADTEITTSTFRLQRTPTTPESRDDKIVQSNFEAEDKQLRNRVRPTGYVEDNHDTVQWSSDPVSINGAIDFTPASETALNEKSNLPNANGFEVISPESNAPVDSEASPIDLSDDNSVAPDFRQSFNNPVLSGEPLPFPPMEMSASVTPSDKPAEDNPAALNSRPDISSSAAPPTSPEVTTDAVTSRDQKLPGDDRVSWDSDQVGLPNNLNLNQLATTQNQEPVEENDQHSSRISEMPGMASFNHGSGDFEVTRRPTRVSFDLPTDTSEFSDNGSFAAPKARVASLPSPPLTQQRGPTAALNANDFLLAGQPELGAHYVDDRPQRDPCAYEVEPILSDFSPDPVDPYEPYDPGTNMLVYEGKQHNANQRPLIELGRPWYQLGQLSPPSTIFGAHNPVTPQFIIFGDHRTAYASDRQNGDSTNQVAFELNLFWNLQLTSTERFHMFVAPVDNGVRNTRYLLDEDEFEDEYDFDVDFGYFEGDLGAMVGGWTGQTLPFDLPFALGVMPLLVQNGVWMEDFFLGVAMTVPARNSARFDISNMDFTFFAGFDEIISDAFEGEDDAAKMWGFLSFIEAMNGYWEIDYAFLEDRTARDRSYHNIGIGFTRRYGRFLSNSTRVIANAGQSTDAGENTADGILLISENSLITGHPSTLVPYLNAWIGFDRPQSAARNANAGGVLRNTGILFESDGMTGFPTLDATANETFGAALGTNILPCEFSQQLVVEVAALGVMGDDAVRRAQGDQYGVGFRYQLPLSNSLIMRADGMYGFLRGVDDIHGVRLEMRRKF